MLQYVFRPKEGLSNKFQTSIDPALALVLAIDHPYTTGLLLLYFGAGPLLFCFFKGTAILWGTFLYLFGFEKPSVDRGPCLFNCSYPVFSPTFCRGLSVTLQAIALLQLIPTSILFNVVHEHRFCIQMASRLNLNETTVLPPLTPMRIPLTLPT